AEPVAHRNVAPGMAEHPVGCRHHPGPRGPGVRPRELRAGEVYGPLVAPRADTPGDPDVLPGCGAAALATGSDRRGPAGSRGRHSGESDVPDELVPARGEPGCPRRGRHTRSVCVRGDGSAGPARPARPVLRGTAAGPGLLALDHHRHDRGCDLLRLDVPIRRSTVCAVRGGIACIRGGPHRPQDIAGTANGSHGAVNHREDLPRAAQRGACGAHGSVLAPPDVGPRPGSPPHERNRGMISRRNLLKSAPLAAAGGLALSACGSGGSSGGSGGAMTWMAMLHTPTTPDPSGPVKQALLDYTESEYNYQWVPDAAKEEKVNSARASGTIPDISSLHQLAMPSIRDVLSSGLFWEVDDYLADYSNLSKIKKETIEGARIDGH